MTTAAQPPRRPPGRYDEPRALPRPVLTGLAALLLAALVLGSYLAYERFVGGRIGAGLTAYEVVDDSTVRISFVVDKPAGSAALCRLQARGRDGSVVGTADVEVGPTQTSVAHLLATSARAATGELVGCIPAAGRP